MIAGSITVAAGEAGSMAAEETPDGNIAQLDRSRGGESSVEVHIATNPHPLGDYGGAIAVSAGKVGATAVQPTGDIRAGAPQRASERGMGEVKCLCCDHVSRETQ